MALALKKASEEKTSTGTTAEERPVENDGSASSVCEVDERALIRKMDFRLIPWLSLLYLSSFLDRTSIGNAKLYGLVSDLHITDSQYLFALSIFFISYWLFEVPSNILLKRLRPSVWFSFLITVWGTCMTVQGLIHNYGGLLAVRWLLGMFEAGLFPGITYYLSCWYKRSEFGFRTAIFGSANTVSGAFGGLLAAAISNMDNVGGKPAWAWIFILEGLATIIIGVISFWIIQDFPDISTFLTEPERAFVVKRLQDDGQFSAAGEGFKFKYILQSVRDRKTWLFIMLTMGFDGPLYAFSLFTPSIINQVRPCFTATPANLLSVPIYVFGCLLTCIVGFYADRLAIRGYFNLATLSMGMIGYIILIVSRSAALSYFAVYLAAAGIYPTVANSITWYANNVEGSYKRGVTLALAIGFGNLQGAVTSNVYRARDTPWYTLGHAIQLGYIVLAFIATLLIIFSLRAENRRRDRGERDEVIVTGEKMGALDEETEKRGKANGVYESIEMARREKGDAWSGYRYHL